MNISFDLDNVIFNMEPIYQKAFDGTGLTYYKPKFWNVRDCYPEQVANNLIKLFGDDMLYQMKVIDDELPYIINKVLSMKGFDTSFVTERLKKQPLKTHNQLLRNGIICSREQVYDEYPPKIEVLKKIKSDLHFDDSPNVVEDCLRNGVDIIMISNDDTLYNHHLRSKVEHYNSLKTALMKTRIYTK